VPSGAHEILVSDIDGPVISAASKTPFESRRRVFVIERADELGDEAANRMLKTLEEPASFVHLILLTDRLGEILPTIRSRCQAVRFEAPTEEQASAAVRELGVSAETAVACVRLSLQDADRALELASPEGRALREAAERYARTALAGEMTATRPWSVVLEAVRARGTAAATDLEARAEAELELTARKEQTRVKNDWTERIRRTRRRVQTGALDLALQLVSLWFADLACLAWEAPELVRNVDRPDALAADAQHGPDAMQLRRAIELVEETRERFLLNVSEDLACEALAYRLQDTLAR
jgi:DNA polymerase-3 subunit delta'